MSLSRAQTLPLDVLLLICQLATDPHPSQFAHGGQLPGSRWDSNELVHPLALVCRGWSIAAHAVLYESIAVLDGQTSRLFLRTIERRPQLGQLVRRLVLGLRDQEDELAMYSPASFDRARSPKWQEGVLDGGSEDEARSDSFVLGEIITRCRSVIHLQIRRPLHHSVRDVMMATLSSRRWDTIVCAPRMQGPGADWVEGFYRTEDVLTLAKRTDGLLEIECALACGRGPPEAGGELLVEGGSPSLLVSPVPLRGLRLECNVEPAFLRNVLRWAHKLEHLDVYTERVTTAEDAFSETSDEAGSSRLLTLR